LTKCAECIRFGFTRTDQVTYPCALCGELRCEEHAVWVPAHELEKNIVAVTRVRSLLKYEKQRGYYVFCGRGAHIPRGLPIRHGVNKQGGKIVSPVLDNEKSKGLEFFRMWETGIIEGGFEKKWESKHYSLSCSLAPVMVVLGHLLSGVPITEQLVSKAYATAVIGMTSKKSVFEMISWEDFRDPILRTPEVKTAAILVCSHCKVVPCVNRQAPFYDSKRFKKLVKEPVLET
jgi:hypothetical protein